MENKKKGAVIRDTKVPAMEQLLRQAVFGIPNNTGTDFYRKDSYEEVCHAPDMISPREHIYFRYRCGLDAIFSMAGKRQQRIFI